MSALMQRYSASTASQHTVAAKPCACTPAAHHPPLTHQPHPAVAAAWEARVIQRLNVAVISIQILPATTTTTATASRAPTTPHATPHARPTPWEATTTPTSLELEAAAAPAPGETACSNAHINGSSCSVL